MILTGRDAVLISTAGYAMIKAEMKFYGQFPLVDKDRKQYNNIIRREYGRYGKKFEARYSVKRILGK